MKKQKSNWYIAATHYLTAGFVVPLILGLLASFLASMIPIFNTGIGKTLFQFVFLVLAIWLGVMYSARYLKKAYIITPESKQRIALLATIYFVVLRLGYYICGFVWAMTKIRVDAGMVMNFLLDVLIFAAVSGALFYYFSRKYITEDSAMAGQ